LVQGDPEVVVNELRGWLDDMLHRTVTAPMVWQHLAAKGFARRLLAGDPTTAQALAATVERHRRLLVVQVVAELGRLGGDTISRYQILNPILLANRSADRKIIPQYVP
jgi:hypothetical protein